MNSLEARVRDLEEYNNRQDMKIEQVQKFIDDAERRLRRIERTIYLAVGGFAVVEILIQHFR